MVEPPRVPLPRRLARAYGLHEARAYGRTAWLLTLGTLLLGLGRGLVGPYIVLFLVAERGLPLAAVGAGVTLEFLVRAAVGPLAGGVSDRVGRKPLMVVGLASTGLLLPAYLLVETVPAFVALSAANGLLAAHSLYGPAANALVTDVLPPGRRGAVFGLIHAARNLGFTTGVGLGLGLASGSAAPLFVAAAAPALLFLVFLLPLVEAPPPPPGASARPPMWRDWRRLLATGPFVAFLLLSPAFYLGWGQINTLFPLFLTEGLGLGRAAVALVGVNSALIVLLQVPFGRLADRAPRPRLLAAAAVALAAAYVGYAASTTFVATAQLAPLLAGLMLFTLAELLYTPVLTAYAADVAPAGTVGSALGLVGFAQAVGIGAPPLLADALLPWGGWSLVWVAMALLCVPSALAFARMRAAQSPR